MSYPSAWEHRAWTGSLVPSQSHLAYVAAPVAEGKHQAASHAAIEASVGFSDSALPEAAAVWTVDASSAACVAETWCLRWSAQSKNRKRIALVKSMSSIS